MPRIAGIGVLMESGHGRRSDDLGKRLGVNGLYNFFMQLLNVLDSAGFGFISQ